MKGYKVFNPGWTCRDFQYEVGKTYTHDGTLKVCGNGFHFCEKAIDCFNYYSFDPNNKVAEVEAVGDVLTDGDKSVTNKLVIVREVEWSELLNIVNTGKGNSGHSNGGHWNSGNRNCGDRNGGDSNSGDSNSGNWNSGNWNLSNGNAGCFNTETHTIRLFDKESDLTLEQWRNSDAHRILMHANVWPTKWVSIDNMTDDEKSNNPNHTTSGGYLKEVDMHKEYREWWKGLRGGDKKTIMDITNFDADKFELITGINVKEGETK